jgi:nucleotidyltransferase/DNA polymerase involved in DNA repair
LTPIEKAQGLGPTMGAELRRVGIASKEELQAIGLQDAWARLIERYPGRLNRNAAYGLAAAVLEMDWRRLPAEVKAEILTMSQQLRRHLIL